MPLSQSEIKQSAMIAVLIVKGKTEGSLKEWHAQLQTEVGELALVQFLYDLFFRISNNTRFEFVEDVVSRIKNSLNQRFAPVH
jgi:hypothetical protein